MEVNVTVGCGAAILNAAASVDCPDPNLNSGVLNVFKENDTRRWGCVEECGEEGPKPLENGWSVEKPPPPPTIILKNQKDKKV